jgi:hypothetical protein
MPNPKRVNSRVIWDLEQLDAAFARLPSDGIHLSQQNRRDRMPDSAAARPKERVV